MPPPPKISDAERLALQTLWRGDGFVDSGSARFAHRSRFYQWRINVALVITLVFLTICWFAPHWLADQLHIHAQAREWFTQYLMLRGTLAAVCLAVGLFCWQRHHSMLSFWIGFSLFTSAMWALDHWLVSATDTLEHDSGTPLLWPVRILLLAIGLINIWRHAFTPLPQQRRLLSWPIRAKA